jgi:hypothetical protein
VSTAPKRRNPGSTCAEAPAAAPPKRPGTPRRGVVSRNLDEDPARRWHGPKPTPRSHRFQDGRSRPFRRVPPPVETVGRSSFDWVKLESGASAESPRHRSARVSTAEALDTSRSLSPRPVDCRSRHPAVPPRGNLERPPIRDAEATLPGVHRSPPCHRSSALGLPRAARRSGRPVTPPPPSAEAVDLGEVSKTRR